MSATERDHRLWGWLTPDAPDLIDAHPAMAAFLSEQLGLPGLQKTPPKPLDEASIAPSALSEASVTALNALFGQESVDLTPLGRAQRSLGQSYPDQLRRRSGSPGPVADAVVHVADRGQLAPLLALAKDHHLRLVPVGGATNVVGAFDTSANGRPLVAVSLAGLNRVLSINEMDQTVTVEAGMTLVDLEQALGAKGYTLGHFPQSYQGATVGGSLMANGAGQVSDLYGRMSDMLISARLMTPCGLWSTEPFRHAGAGPWMGGLVAGSEGLFGLLMDLTLKIRPKPAFIEDRAWYLPSFDAGCAVLRTLAQDGHDMAMLRLSDPAETAFFGKVRLLRKGLTQASWLERTVLAMKQVPAMPALLLGAYEGSHSGKRQAFRQVNKTVRRMQGVALGTGPGQSWRKSRFDTPHLRESILAHGLAVDTFETATTWSNMGALHQALISGLSKAGSSVPGGGKAIVFSHVSHTYAEGASLYATMIYCQGPDPMGEWRGVKQAAAEAIHMSGATISHHHGLGAMHAADALLEKSETGRRLMAAIRAELDPDRILTSGADHWLE